MLFDTFVFITFGLFNDNKDLYDNTLLFGLILWSTLYSILLYNKKPQLIKKIFIVLKIITILFSIKVVGSLFVIQKYCSKDLFWQNANNCSKVLKYE